tara:strand:- start:311 stop:745 length:435 start_codon:yes stop_codon:yes gene_type:complete
MLVTRNTRNVVNPFIEIDEHNNESNALDVIDDIDINIEDIIIGCIRSFKADKPESDYKDYVNLKHVIKIYRYVDSITAKNIANALRCSQRQSYRVLSVIKLCNPFIINHLKQPRTNIVGYADTVRSIPYVVHKEEKSGKIGPKI